MYVHIFSQKLFLALKSTKIEDIIVNICQQVLKILLETL